MSGERGRFGCGWCVAAVIVLAGASGAGVYYLRSGDESTAAVYRPAVVRRGDLKVRVLSTGVVEPENRLEIKPPIPGRIEEVLVAEGDAVKKGQILAWMSSTERAALLDAARARGGAEVMRWEQFYRATPVVAPIDGMIIVRGVEPGQTFTSQDAVLVMSDRLAVKAQVDETDIAQVVLGQAAEITLDAYPERSIPGRVGQIAFEAVTVNNVTTYAVDVLPVETPSFMRSGMTANVSFAAADRTGVLLVAAEALKVIDGKTYALVASAGSAAEPPKREVQTGLSDGRFTEVVAGLEEGDEVLIEGARSAAPAQFNPFSPFGRRRGEAKAK